MPLFCCYDWILVTTFGRTDHPYSTNQITGIYVHSNIPYFHVPGAGIESRFVPHRDRPRTAALLMGSLEGSKHT